MLSENLYKKLGIIQLMQILQELHRSGYQGLRWFPYMAPTGMSLRCHITTADNIVMNRELRYFDEEHTFSLSTAIPDAREDIHDFIGNVVRESPLLYRARKIKDSEYISWFNDIVERAKSGEFPIFNGEWFSAPIGQIIVGKNYYPGPPMRMKLISWNINGIKAKFEALKALVAEHSPDIICLQKVKDISKSNAFDLPGYTRKDSVASYAGVTTYYKECFITKSTPELVNPVFDGHLLRTEFIYPQLTLFNTYVPYSNPQIEGAIAHRRSFDHELLKLVSDTPDRIIVCGDMNIVHSELDCWDKKYKRDQANFHDWERQNFDNLLEKGGLIDTFRLYNPNSDGGFTYFFRNDPKVRAANQGHRIDYFLASRSFIPNLRRTEIIQNVTTSTNNPIILELTY